MTEVQSFYYFYDAKGGYLQSYYGSSKEAEAERDYLNATFGGPPYYIAAGVHGFEIDPPVRDAIISAFSIPHAWGGRYDPTVRTIHGDALFGYVYQIPDNVWAIDTIYENGTIVAHEGKVYEAKYVATSTVDNVPGGAVDSWTQLFVYDAASQSVPLGEKGLNGAIYLKSSALMPAEVGVQFTAEFPRNNGYRVMVGFGVNKPDITTDERGINKGLLFGISTSSSDKLGITVKSTNGLLQHFDPSIDWGYFNGATNLYSNLIIPLSKLKDGNTHTFKFEHNKGLLTVSVDGTRFGEFTYPDATYPLRQYLTGDHAGEQVKHSGQYFSLQSVAGSPFRFDLYDLCFYRPGLHQISRNFSDINPHNLNIRGDTTPPSNGSRVQTLKLVSHADGGMEFKVT